MFGQKLQQLRARAGLTQAELAQKLGVPADSVIHWEVHGEEPGKAALIKLAHALAVPEQELTEALDQSRRVRVGEPLAVSRERP